MAGALRVATHTLSELSSEMRSVSDRVNATAKLLDQHGESVGHHAVRSALQGFEEHWARGRRKLRDHADALADMLADSADEYVQADAEIAGAISRDESSVSVGGAG